MNILNKAFAGVSLGMAVIGILPIVTAQVKSPSTLDADVVWNEVMPVLMQIGLLIGHNVNMALAEKITRNAVLEIKTWTPAK